MNDFNKIISLFIGLFVVIFVIAFVLGRIKLGNKTAAAPTFGGAIGSIFNKTTPTPKPRPTTIATKPITIKRTVESQPATRIQTNQVTVYNTNGTVKTIPKTGPELLLPFSLLGLFGGVSLLSKFRNA